MRHYALASLHDPHLRLALAHAFKQQLNLYGVRLRVALGHNGNHSWYWHGNIHSDRVIAANSSLQDDFVLWPGLGSTLSHENHSSAVVDLDTGQLHTADVSEELPALWQAPGVAPYQMEVQCTYGVHGSGVHDGHDVTWPMVRHDRICERHCLKSNCSSFTFKERNGGGYECIVHLGYSSSNVYLESMAGAQFCSKHDSSLERACGVLSVSGNAELRYASGSNMSGRYKRYEVATIVCQNKTYFPTKVWLSNMYFTKWQEWQPGSNAEVVSEESSMESLSYKAAAYSASAQYRGYAYIVLRKFFSSFSPSKFKFNPTNVTQSVDGRKYVGKTVAIVK